MNSDPIERKIRIEDAWCQDCGAWDVVETYYDSEPIEFVEGEEICKSCKGAMTFEEPKK
jgi:hypothetical protein